MKEGIGIAFIIIAIAIYLNIDRILDIIEKAVAN
jgi:hypothetical protein